MTELQLVMHGAKLTWPEMRMGQIIINCLPVGVDLFYVTDKMLITFLRKYMNEHGDLRC